MKLHSDPLAKYYDSYVVLRNDVKFKFNGDGTMYEPESQAHAHKMQTHPQCVRKTYCPSGRITQEYVFNVYRHNYVINI